MKKFFLLALCMIGFAFAQAQTSPYKGSEAAAGNFYIYNVETGYWLQNNNRVGDWNSQVQVDVHGFDWELIAQDGGTWQLNPKFGNNHSLNSGEANGYLDTGQPVSAWTLTPANDGNNGYMISSNGTTLGVNPDTKLLTKDGSGATTWQFVTEEERLQVQAAKFAEVTGDNPMDISWMIPGANFNIADEHADALKKVAPDAGAPFVSGQTNVNPGNGIREIWSNNGAYDIGYTLTGLPDGVYRFTVSGYYRDGSCDNAGWTGVVGQKHKDGTETIRPEIYLNDLTQPIMSICAPGLTAAAHGCNRSSAGIYLPDNTSQASEATAAKLYENKEMKIVLTNGEGTIDLGVRASEGIGDDWLILDYFKLVYYGPEDISQSVAILQAALNEAKAWNSSNTSTVLANKLNQAIVAAIATLSSTDGEEMEAVAEELKAALKAAQAVDLSVLKATVELAKKEGIDTSAANDIFENATDGGAAAALVEELRTARKMKALGGAPDIYTGEEPAAGEFYFYNIGTGMWLNQGSDWCTHAAVDQTGLLVTFEVPEDGEGFIFRTPWGTFNDSPYTDTGGNTVYKFQAVDGKEGVYNILEGEDLLGWNPDGKTDGKKYWSSISNVADADPADPNYQWKVVSKAQRDELLAKASLKNPVDASYLINNASLMRQPGYDMWEKEVHGGNGGARVSSQDDNNGDRAADFGYEYWNCDDFKFSQKITGLKPGAYEVSATGFWREGDGGNQGKIVSDGGALNQKGYLFANNNKALLPNIASCLDFVPGVGTATSTKGNFPNWPREAIEYFETGAFKTTVTAIVGEDGELTIGIGVDEKVAYGDWVVFDNFRLTYLGNDENEVAYERALTSIENGKTYRVFTEVKDTKYYLTPDGYLTDSEQEAGTYKFNKVAGDEFPYGFQLLESYFTNPPVGGNPTLTNGHIATDANSKRNNWEAQVFFQNAKGKYAVRATNAAGGESSWALNAKTFWTVNEGPVAEYSFDQNFVWQIEENIDPRPEILAEIKPITDTWAWKMQEIGGLVTDASQFSANSIANESIGLAGLSDGDYNTYFHSQWGNSGVTEAHYLQAELPDAADKFYFYFVKRDPINNGNVNNRPTDILISGSNDGETFTEITEINQGMPTAVPPIDYMSGLVTASEAYKYIRFTILDTNNHATDDNGNKFFTFSEFYILPSTELFDDATALMYTKYTDIPLEGTDDLVDRVNEVNDRINENFVDVSVNVLFNGEVVKSEDVSMPIGKAPKIPASLNNGLVEFSDSDVETVTAETEAVNLTATFKGPFEFSESFNKAKWYNMTIRTNYWVAVDETEPYYPKADKDLDAETSQWAFIGNPYNLVIINKAAGNGKSLTKDGNNVVMRDGEYIWELFGNNKENGFVIREIGTDNNWVNQNGGQSGPLQFWNSTSGRDDDGSTFRVEKVVDPYDRALAAIEDGGQYRIFTEIDGQKYYVTEGGLLTSSNKDSGVFTLKKVAGTASQYKEYGFKIDSGSKRFTNPPLANNVADMTRGVFATTTDNRDDWEAQVFFMMGNKYAIRSCNVPDGTSSWNDAGRTYWTWVVEDVPTPQYTYDMVYCWQLEGPLTTINVTYALQEADGTTISSVTKQQESNSEVNVPADLTSHFAYEYAISGTIGDEDCTITVTRTFKEGVVHSLDELSNEKAYTIRCDRGALLTKDGYVASTAHSSLTNAEAAEFAIINYEGNYYLYSVADGQFMTFDPTVSDDGSRGPLADTPVHGTEDAVILEAKTDPYFFAYFSANGTNYGFNTNGNNPYGYVINTWMTADPGNQYYIIESSDFDPTQALAALASVFDGIKDIKSDVNKTVYDIAGRRVAEPTKGVFIINRKKVAVK